MVGRDARDEGINWKVLFKLGENWRNGACPPGPLDHRVLTSFFQVDALSKHLNPAPEHALLPRI